MHERTGHLGKALMNMFGVPRGLLGRLGGRLMALEHSRVNPFVVEQLAVEPDDRIVEVGCGPGVAAALAASRVANGFVAAVDVSPVMVAQARRRLRAAIKAGRAEVVQAPAEKLPFENETFDGAFTVFSLHHWADRKQGLSELLRVLRSGGRLLVVERVGGHSHAQDSNRPDISEERIDHYLSILGEIGFSEVECAAQEVGGRKLMVLRARRPIA